MSDTHLSPAPRGLRARAGAVAIAIAAALTFALSPLPAAATTPTPTPTATAPDSEVIEPGEIVFTLAPVGNGVVRPGDALNVSVTTVNGTDAATTPAQVTLALGRAPLASRAALTAWLAGSTTGVAVDEVGEAMVDSVAPGAIEPKGIAVAADDPALAGRAPGVYPIVARSTSASGELTSTSVMIVPDDEAVARVGVIVPITAPAPGAATATDAGQGDDEEEAEGDAAAPDAAPVVEGLLTAEQLAELTATGGDLAGQLDAVDGTNAILAIDPAIPAAIRVLGESAPETATAWLEHLMSLPNARFALQFGDADVAVQVQAGASRPLVPLSLQAYMSAADFPTEAEVDAEAESEGEPGDAATPSPTRTSDPTAPVFPTMAELLDIGGARPGVYWPVAGTADETITDTLGGITSDDLASLTIVPSTSTSSGASGATVPARASSGEAAVLVYDDTISRALLDASLLAPSTLRAASLTAATAHLAFAADDVDGAPLLVTLDRATDRSRVGIRSALMSVFDAPGVQALTLGDIDRTSAVGVDLRDAEPDAARVAAASALFGDEDRLARFATILDEPSLLTGPQRAEILQLLSAAGVADVTRPASIEAHRAATATTLDAVGIIAPDTVQQVSPTAGIPVYVRNELPYPVNVVLNAAPDDLRLDVQKSTRVDGAQPNSSTPVAIPVQAQLGSGDVTLELQLRSRTFEPIGDPQYAQVLVRADWEGIGVGVLAVLVSGLLIVGLVRTVLRRRRDRREGAE